MDGNTSPTRPVLCKTYFVYGGWRVVAGTKEAQEGVGSPGIVVTVVNEPMLGLGTELGSFKRATNSLKH